METIFLRFPKNGPCINAFQTNLRNFWLSVTMEFCLSSVICGLPSAKPSLFRGQEYLLKVGCIILVDSNVVEFWIFETVFVAGCKHCPMSEKNITQINGICVWYNIASSNRHRMCVYSMHTFFFISTCQMWLQITVKHVFLAKTSTQSFH